MTTVSSSGGVSIIISGARGPKGDQGEASGPLVASSVGEDEINATEGAGIRDKIGAVGLQDVNMLLPPSQPITIIAHRGFARQYPQNTTLAFTGAAQSGADALETDLSVSSDGELYCFHDATVDARTDGTGTFTALSSATIDGLVFDATVGTAYANLRIPKFSAFLQIARRFGLYAYPEIKNYRTQADIDLIIAAIEAEGMESQCTLSSFSFSDLDYVRAANSEIGVMFQSSNIAAAPGDIDYLADYGGRTALLMEPASMFADFTGAASVAAYARSKNVDFISSTIVSQTSQQVLSQCGVAKFFSDVRMVK
ncbi:glycerophosphodiester phosphodiesterase [Sphingobium sp. ZW T5_29]|uniref:glycerophosphodiester phosphodiesterase n=1 Tax=Sphingobium sp. ZW T5_29 TaxID=3378077 RepID=UPI00385402C2